MEENVALDSSKQKQFVKSIKGIKNLIKKGNDEQRKLDGNQKIKDGKFKKKSKERGLVYLSHIPHGFYEHEMTQYFKQFGVVTNSRVIRSKRTGNSKGHAFVEFKEPTVAQIVAETMNNYLMGKRLIKAVYIPPEEQKRNAFRKRWNSQNNPGNKFRLKMKKAYNETKDEKGELKRAKKLLTNLLKTKQKLKEMGINYDFFQPVDIPPSLLDLVKKEVKPIVESIKVEQENTKNVIKQETSLKVKKSKKKSKLTVTKNEIKHENELNQANETKENKIKRKEVVQSTHENDNEDEANDGDSSHHSDAVSTKPHRTRAKASPAQIVKEDKQRSSLNKRKAEQKLAVPPKKLKVKAVKAKVVMKQNKKKK